MNLGSATLSAGTSNSSTFSGILQGAGGSFNKLNSGTLTLTGTLSATGTLTVSNGRVVV